MANANFSSDELSNLDSNQLSSLRDKLQAYTSGDVSTVTQQLEEDPACCHSSHFDNDGWI